MSRLRSVGSLLVMIGFVAFTTATSKPKKNTGSSSGAVPVATPPPPFVPSSPQDIDAFQLGITLGCGAKAANVGCKLLKDFDTAETFFERPAEALFFGETHAIGGAADGKKEFFFVQVATGAGSFVGAARTLLPDNAKETADAFKLLAASKAGTAVAGSEAAKFMRGSTPPGGMRAIVRTLGRSQALAQFPTQVYIRSKGDHLLIVEHTGAPLGHDSSRGPGPALAWVSEAFRVR